MTLINEICEYDANYQSLLKSDLLLLKDLGYKKHEKVVYDLKNEYHLLYMNFEKI